MEEFVLQLSNGLAVGGIYALIALGYTMVYGVLRLINFAHGELFTLGSYLGLTALAPLALYMGPGAGPLVLAAITAIGLVAITGYLLERVAYRPLRGASRLSAVVSALGASIFFQNAMMLCYGASPLVYPSSLLPARVLTVTGVELPALRIGVCTVSFLLMCALYWFIHKTRTGTAIRAAAIDPDVARLMGVNVNTVVSLVFMIGAGLGAAAGIMVGLYYSKIQYDMGVVYGLKAFTAAILGGIGNIPGAMLGGILLGVIEALAAAYLSTAWNGAIAFLVLIAILIFRPTGILGERTADRQ